MGHEVIRTINNRKYRYYEESYRVPGLRTPRKRSTYLGPVDPVERKPKKGIFGVLDDLVRKKHDWEHTEETPVQERERIGREDRERARTSRNNDLLTGKSISLDELAEVASTQKGEDKADKSTVSESAAASDAADTGSVGSDASDAADAGEL
jgi:hypothetical protein